MPLEVCRSKYYIPVDPHLALSILDSTADTLELPIRICRNRTFQT